MSCQGDAIRVLLADDHHVVREAIATMIGLEPNLLVVGQAGTHQEVIDLNACHRPQVVLLDFQFVEGPSLALIPRLLSAGHGPKVLMLSSFAASANVFAALDAGASGYLLKSSKAVEVIAAIRKVSAGGVVMTAEHVGRPAAVGSCRHAANPLTLRETHILKLIARGFSNDDIARQLMVTLGTVKTHVHHLLEKLEARNRTEALMVARQRGYLSDA